MTEAYKKHPPLKIQMQIESIAAFDDNVILGTRQGVLLMYSIKSNPREQKTDFQLLQYNKTFSKKPIMQLEVVRDLKILFSLSDNIVSVNDVNHHNSPLIHTAANTKGANVFAIDSKTSESLTGELVPLVRMCVAIKRKLQLWYWKYDHLKELQESIDLSDVPKGLAFSGNSICVGYKTEYVLYDISTPIPTKRDLFPISSSRTMEPCISKFREDVFGIAKDEFLISIYAPVNQELPTDQLYNTMAEDTEKKFGTLQWSEPLQQLVYDEPYLIGLVADSLEVRVFNTLSTGGDTLIQKIPDLSRIRFLARGNNGILYAAAASQVWCIEMVDITVQRKQLLLEKKFQLALQLTRISNESNEEKQMNINKIQTLYASELFHNKNFKASVTEFFKLGTDPIKVIELFPELLDDTAKPIFEDKELEQAYLALIDYLTEWRQKIRKESAVPTSKDNQKNAKTLLSIIDTTLLKCYLQTNDSLVASVLRLNNCNLEESEKVLRKHRKYGELIILYQIKKQHESALKLLQDQAEKPGSSLFGYEHTIRYLHNLDAKNIDLIFKFADWVLRKHPEDGLKIFTEDGLSEVEGLPRAKVLDMLLQRHKDLVIPYLEQIIHGPWNETKGDYHNILIKLYKDKVLHFKANAEREEHKVQYEKYRKKLIKFLKTSEHYHAEKILIELPTTDLFEERALILTKLGKYNQAIAVYHQILGDTERAIEYCAEVYDKANPATHGVYTHLVRSLLNPPRQPLYNDVPLHPRSQECDVETVIEIIEKHTDKVEPEEIIRLMPSDIPLIRLKKFLETSMHLCLENKRRMQVLKGLYYAGHLQLQEQRIKLQSQHFTITELSTCEVCRKKFSNQSAIVRLPNGNIVHYSCHQTY